MAVLTSLAQNTDLVTVTWGDGTSDAFHYVWLRDNCRCPECRHPDAWERTLDTVTLALDVVPSSLELGDSLAIRWSDGHETMLSAEWLRQHAYSPEARARRQIPISTWTAASITADPPIIGFDEIEAGDDGMRRWLALVRDYGFAIVENVPRHVGAVVELAERIAFIQETNFGRSFQVISKPDPENLAYTSVKLNPHTRMFPTGEAFPGCSSCTVSSSMRRAARASSSTGTKPPPAWQANTPSTTTCSRRSK